jgi:hypothetical protein
MESVHMVLKAKWTHYGKSNYILEVFVVGKWRSVHVHAKKPRSLKNKDIVQAQYVVNVNTGGRILVDNLRLSKSIVY